MIRCNEHPWRPAVALLCALALLALFPPTVAGKPGVTLYGGDTGDSTGDPIDSNDYGSGGGSHDDIQDSYCIEPAFPRAPGVVVGRWLVLLVPDRSLGVPVFSFVVIERAAIVGEGWYAR